MNFSRRFRPAFWPALAALFHALAGIALWLTPVRNATVVAPAVAELAPSEIDLAIEVPSEAEPGPAEAEEATAAATEPARAASVAGRAPSPSPEPSPALSSSSEGTTPSEPGSPAPPPVRLTTVGPDIGIGGTNRFLPTSQAAVEDAEARRSVNRAMKDPARDRERELGLGPEGPVLTALAESTARSLAPVKGRAVFVATTNAAGEVVTIDLGETEGSRAGWDDAKKIALAALAGKKLRLPAGATRAVMKIEVTSAWKMPSGQDPGMDLDLFHIPIAKGEGKDSPKMSILDPIPKLHVDYLEVGGPGGAKIPLVSIQIDLFSTNADPTNIGARPRRVVHTHAIDTQLM